jgi:uncharacterized oxidoreductase
MQFKNKLVFITGASGIGLKVAQSFLNVGAKVILCDRDPEKLDAVRKQHPNIVIYECNILSLNDMDAIIKKFGEQIDIWVNNTCILQQTVQAEYNLAHRDLENALVFNYYFYNIKIIDQLKKNPEAIIVNMASFSNDNSSNHTYSVISSAFNSFNNALRDHLQDTNIKVFEMNIPVTSFSIADDNYTQVLA